MTTLRSLGLVSAVLTLLFTSSCRLQVDKAENGHDKNVKIDTPFGGIHVNKNATGAADIGLPIYPNAQPAKGNDDDKSADVHVGFGEWQLRVKVVKYHTSDSQDQVLSFYRKALGRYGDVIECHGDQPVGSPTVTREGLTCNDNGGNAKIHVANEDHGGPSLKAGSKRHQHIMGIDNKSEDGTKFALVELDLPADSGDHDRESN